MTIKEYYKAIFDFLNSLVLVSDFHIEFEEIDENTGYISGILDLTDSSNLHFAEFIEFKNANINRLKYRYHWQKADATLIKRWDNVPHYKNISTFPFHCHENQNITSSSPMDLYSTIKEITKYVT